MHIYLHPQQQQDLSPKGALHLHRNLAVNMKQGEAINDGNPSSSVMPLDDDENMHIFKIPFIKRLFRITPLVELLGYMKDHRFHYKEHWIDSCKNEPKRLKSTLMAQYEMEIVLGVLYLSIIIGVMSSAMGTRIRHFYLLYMSSLSHTNSFLY